MEKKKQQVKNKVWKDHGCGSVPCSRCVWLHSIIDKMCDSNIPAGYWLVNLSKFSGPPKLKEIAEEYMDQLDQNYSEGNSICFAGSQGTGKTLSSISILKSAIKKNFSVYYITASDMLNEMTNSQARHETRTRLREADFLVIDELDSRFFTSDSAKELFSSVYENIFRYRTHNSLPTIICTNETSGILNVFFGPSVQSIESLNHQYLNIYPIAGQDFRKRG